MKLWTLALIFGLGIPVLFIGGYKLGSYETEKKWENNLVVFQEAANKAVDLTKAVVAEETEPCKEKSNGGR